MDSVLVPEIKAEISDCSEIHVWYASLNQPESRFFDMLSVDEIIRADRFRSRDNRNRFIVRRGILRTLLGLFLNLSPQDVRFNYGDHGKPGVANAYDKKLIHFNLSHSEDRAVFVFTRDGETGVDIERIRDIPEMGKIVELYFSPAEKSVFDSTPDNEKQALFFRLWTRKEAFIKAIGDGLSMPLDKVDMSDISRALNRAPVTDGNSTVLSRWVVRDLKPAPGYSAALGVEEQKSKIKYWEWLDGEEFYSITA